MKGLLYILSSLWTFAFPETLNHAALRYTGSFMQLSESVKFLRKPLEVEIKNRLCTLNPEPSTSLQLLHIKGPGTICCPCSCTCSHSGAQDNFAVHLWRMWELLERQSIGVCG